jgi:hypothetical protein
VALFIPFSLAGVGSRCVSAALDAPPQPAMTVAVKTKVQRCIMLTIFLIGRAGRGPVRIILAHLQRWT